MKGHERDYTSTGQPPWKSPLAFSLLLHGALILVALVGWHWTTPSEELPPRSIAATLVVQQPQAPQPEAVPQPDPEDVRRRQEEQRREAERKAAEAERQRAEAERQRREQERQAAAERERQRQAQAREAARLKAEAEARELARQKAEEEERRQQEEARAAEAERRRREAEERARREREEQERQAAEERRREQERQLREQQLKALAEQADREREQARRRQAEAAAAARAHEQQMLSDRDKYHLLIKQRLNQAWYRPPSATEGMVARLRITLLPNGELASVQLIQGSGNTAFDNSALSAVRSISRYPLPDDRDTFERYFRQFTIEFTPQELR
ncbi:MAG: cell envelope integrity protein TolA [Marinobacter sp.]|uniref:cell envelope integrity protein TolA n=1 Tax=Marinobacter sp. TaxID=50741 RepID=UPI00299E58BC|nr:cell envelope integrity protein TolA [Marinobacter sp.]MDX1754850.1 cell envelope integrity protein TolA [Marinobacter sp.]